MLLLAFPACTGALAASDAQRKHKGVVFLFVQVDIEGRELPWCEQWGAEPHLLGQDLQGSSI